jgi:hypothetical protein
MKRLSEILIFLSFLIFGVFVWFGINYSHLHGSWGFGIWLVSVGVFISGILMRIDNK